jgi:cellobiose transport system permease protein
MTGTTIDIGRSSTQPVNARAPRRRRRATVVPWWIYIILILAAVGSIFPLYWMFVVASSNTAAATQMPPRVIPGDNFLHMVGVVFSTVPFVQSILNSVIIALAIGGGQALLCSLAGFAFAKLQFRGRNVLFLVVLLTMTVPAQLSIIPQYMIISGFNWVDTLQAVIFPGLASAFGIFWMRQHLATTMDDDLMGAARIDGANSWQIFWRIGFPIVRPAAFVLGLLGFVTSWNDFLWPLIVLKSPGNYTVQLAIQALQKSYTVNLSLALAGSFLATIPLLIVFFFVGRRLVAGIMDGAFKG